jgi:hypothetical protein
MSTAISFKKEQLTSYMTKKEKITMEKINKAQEARTRLT